MSLYEKRTYSVTVGRMAEAQRLYAEEGWPVLEAEGFSANCVGYFVSDTGPLHQLVHLWRFDDDAARRAFWARLYASEAFMAFAAKLRPLLQAQEVQLLNPAPWGSHP
ncbi:MAG: NIPSNAP family protein [Gammaproteobacteria bacterium]